MTPARFMGGAADRFIPLPRTAAKPRRRRPRRPRARPILLFLLLLAFVLSWAIGRGGGGLR